MDSGESRSELGEQDHRVRAPTCHTQGYIGGGWPYYTTACSGCHGANIAVPDPYEGSYAWYSDYWFDDEGMDTRLTMTLDPIILPAGSLLEFKTWYDIEKDWDYGYVQISTNGGSTWTNLPTSFTTNTNPYGPNLGNGITGASGGWVDGQVDLSAYAGQTVRIRFAYLADFYTYGLGWMLDNIVVGPPGAPIFWDDVETLRPEMTVTTEVSYFDYDLGSTSPRRRTSPVGSGSRGRERSLDQGDWRGARACGPLDWSRLLRLRGDPPAAASTLSSAALPRIQVRHRWLTPNAAPRRASLAVHCCSWPSATASTSYATR